MIMKVAARREVIAPRRRQRQPVGRSNDLDHDQDPFSDVVSSLSCGALYISSMQRRYRGIRSGTLHTLMAQIVEQYGRGRLLLDQEVADRDIRPNMSLVVSFFSKVSQYSVAW
ncbi:hypothetical protein [Bradyrhizobium sp. CCBAU 53338]|uniref:hypothetical protein n=1 Tax=Bradyrhizobium sp. CCBAU 53338 TaxID=1325111 RepID=UPI00188CCAE6|nr:hypothetical protein [Bradyrhizobium sp. CCBAU 53338]